MLKGRKPNARKKGLKILVYGDTGTGKTVFGLSFPKIKAIDSEDGYGWYEDEECGKNILEIFDTQDFYDLESVLNDLVKDKDLGTFIIDSETKIYENLQQALLEEDEKRARAKGRNVLDTNLSVRSWGKIKRIATELQNAKIRLASHGVNIVSVAQSKDLTEEISDNKRIVVGHVPDMKKKANFDYDVVLYLYSKDDKYYAEVEKDRTGVTHKGEILENPSYENWKERIEGKSNQGKIVEKDFVGDSVRSKEKYNAELDKEENESKPPLEQIKDFIATLEDTETKKRFANELVEKTGVKALSKMNSTQLKQALTLIKEFK